MPRGQKGCGKLKWGCGSWDLSGNCYFSSYESESSEHAVNMSQQTCEFKESENNNDNNNNTSIRMI